MKVLRIGLRVTVSRPTTVRLLPTRLPVGNRSGRRWTTTTSIANAIAARRMAWTDGTGARTVFGEGGGGGGWKNEQESGGRGSAVDYVKTAVDRIVAAYRHTDIPGTLAAAPKHVLWTAACPVSVRWSSKRRSSC